MSESSSSDALKAGTTGGVSLGSDPVGVPAGAGAELSAESGVDLKARSQWSYVRTRFLRHRLAVASLVILILIALVGIFAPQLAPYGYDEINLEATVQKPTLEGWHLFGTDQLGRDYLSRVMFGIRTSLWVAVMVAVLATLIGTILGAVAGYYSGQVDNLPMRQADQIFAKGWGRHPCP